MTALATAAGTTRQRLAGVLGTLQQDPNIPATILEIASGLARAIGPLFQVERGQSTDPQLLVQARTVLQETLEKMQGVDQNYPGVSDATGAIAESLRTLFNALREAGVGPAGQPAAAPAPAPAPQFTPAPAPAPQLAPAPAPQFTPAPAPAPQYTPAPAPAPPQPIVAQAAPPRPPSGQMGAVNPAPTAPNPYAPQTPGPQRPPSGMMGAVRAPSAPQPAAHAQGVSVPLGPSGLPRLECEVGVHSESNFYTDFLGDIRNKGGVFVATFHVLPVGTQCEVALILPGNLQGELRGVVRWKRDDTASPGLGVEITQAAPETWNLIDRFIRKREPIMYEA